MQINKIVFNTNNINFQSKKNNTKITNNSVAALQENDAFIAQNINTELGIEDRHGVLNNLLQSLYNPTFERTWVYGFVPCVLSTQLANNLNALSKYYAPKEELELLKKLAGDKKIKKNFDKKYAYYLAANGCIAVTTAQYKEYLINEDKSSEKFASLVIHPDNFGLKVITNRIKELKQQSASQQPSFFRDILTRLSLKK